MPIPPDPPPESPETPRTPPALPPAIPEAWSKPPDPNWKPSPPKAPPQEKTTFEKAMAGIAYTLAGIGILIVVALLLFLGTCLVMIAKHG